MVNFDIIPIANACIIQNRSTYPCKHKISNATLHLVRMHTTSRGNVMSRGISRLVEMPHLVSWKLLFPQKNYALNTQNIVCCHTCPRVEK